MSDASNFGYLMVHFVEDAANHAEKIYFSLSRGEDPTHWYRLNDGQPILESRIGTTGVRDPHLVRAPDGENFYLIGTDLRVFGGDDAGWDAWSSRGSRSILVWESTDLISWSKERLVEIAPPEAGMAWAPEAIVDPATGGFVLTWSSTLYDQVTDPDHRGDSYSRILSATTRDFRSFSAAQVYLDTGSTTIDTTMISHGGKIYRFHKDNGPNGRQLYADVVSSLYADDAIILAERIGHQQFGDVEGPLVFKDNYADRWFLFVDQYGTKRQGYRPFVTDDLSGGSWAPYEGPFELADDTKHGVVLPLRGTEWERLAGAAWGLGVFRPTPD